MNFKALSAKAGKWGIKKVGLLPSKLEKAKIFSLSESGVNINKESITVQFNPAEYSISRGIILTDKHPIGKDGVDSIAQAVSGQPATMSITLYFDTITDLHKQRMTDAVDAIMQKNVTAQGVKNTAKSLAVDQFKPKEKDPVAVADEISQLLRFAHDEHAPRKIEFVWGNLDFIGYVISSTVNYTMFSPNGTPVRAKVDLTIKGEEQTYIQSLKSRPNESPDRTKERTLIEGDNLWQIANDEYSDPSKWKVIAEANGILNPRITGPGVKLRVPSIK